MDTLIGKTLGSYQIISEIGRGGMAIVYKAYQPTLNRYVALKVLPPYLAHDDEFVRRFEMEAQNAARLKHPNIVIIHDVGEEGGYHYIVMEFLEGITLRALVERSRALPEPRALDLLNQIASALDYAHAAGFVHRDVKPANVLIGANDLATLTDFGIAKAAEGTRLTRTGTLMGTPEYMSPEQARGEPVDYRTDIYSLGVVAYEMLSGRVPFDGTTPHAVLHKVIYDAPPPLRTMNPRVSAPVEPAVMRALAKDPPARYASAEEMIRAMVPVPVLPQQSSVPQVPRPRAIGRAGLPILAALGSGIALIILVLLITLGRSSDSRQIVSPPHKDAVTISNANPYVLDKLAPIPAGQAIAINLQTTKTYQVVDLFFELANETPSEVFAFVSPYCDRGIFVGSTRMDASNTARPIWVHPDREVFVNGKFCVSLQTSPDSHVSIGQNQFAQYLIRVVVSQE
jgi:serine/threonine protein kinase